MPSSEAAWIDGGCYRYTRPEQYLAIITIFSAGGVYTQALSEVTDAYTMSPARCTAACQALNMPVAVISSTRQEFGSSIQERQVSRFDDLHRHSDHLSIALR